MIYSKKQGGWSAAPGELPGCGLESLGFNGLRIKAGGTGCASIFGNEP